MLGLLLSCHPLPCLAVTVFAVAYGSVIGAGPGRLAAIAAAVLAGQLCVGWCNDAIDGSADRTAARPDKPIATGLITRRAVAIASAVAAAACAGLSARLGLAAAVLHLAAVASALAYNAGLKRTWLSPAPYLFSFGLLPVVLVLAVHGAGRPPLQQVVAAVLFGGAAHFGNTVGDAQSDALTGVRGLPQRLGPQRSMVVMAVLIAVAAVVLLAGVAGASGQGVVRQVFATALLVGGVVLAGAGAGLKVGVPGGRSAWHLTLAAVGLVIAGFLVAA